MKSYPPQVQRLHDALAGIRGVREVVLGIQGLEAIGERELSLPGEFGDLPHLAIRRTRGGLKNEMLVTAEVRFTQDFTGWIALEFLAWWVRDLSRADHWVQMRPLALPPVGYGTQLGRTLKVVIEFFFTEPGENNAQLLEQLDDFAESLESNLADYVHALANPTQAVFANLDDVRRCAELDDTAALLRLAQHYADSPDMRHDFAQTEAFRLYKKAARLGHPEAMTKVGQCYAKGEGTEADLVKAAGSYRKGAEGGWPLAMGLLAACYENGAGVPKNLQKAVEWYERGAAAGEPACLAELGECYEQGKGVTKDLKKAMDYYQQALAQGFDAVQPALDRLSAPRHAEAPPKNKK